MKNILKLDSPNDYAQFVEAPVLHPLVSIIHYDELSPFRHSLNNYGVYGLFIQRQFPKILSYGMKALEVSDASIIAIAPGQIGGLEDNGERISLCGWVLLWSPELLHGSDLEHHMDRFQYFSYFFTDSLRMEPSEWLCITQLLAQMRQELMEHEDSPALRSILLGYLRLILEYCNRIYQRQFSQEDKGSSDLLKRFHALLQQYFRENRQLRHGLPTVAYCAFQRKLDRLRRLQCTFQINDQYIVSVRIAKKLHPVNCKAIIDFQQRYFCREFRCGSCLHIHSPGKQIDENRISHAKDIGDVLQFQCIFQHIAGNNLLT